jgi:hypothetical protein
MLFNACLCRKLKYIVGEMVDTERDYVKALEYIIQVTKCTNYKFIGEDSSVNGALIWRSRGPRFNSSELISSPCQLSVAWFQVKLDSVVSYWKLTAGVVLRLSETYPLDSAKRIDSQRVRPIPTTLTDLLPKMCKYILVYLELRETNG